MRSKDKHLEKQLLKSKSSIFRESAATLGGGGGGGGGGVDLAKCTILQKPLQSRSKLKATCGSISETSSNIDSNFVNSARFATKNPVQKRYYYYYYYLTIKINNTCYYSYILNKTIHMIKP